MQAAADAAAKAAAEAAEAAAAAAKKAAEEAAAAAAASKAEAEAAEAQVFAEELVTAAVAEAVNDTQIAAAVAQAIEIGVGLAAELAAATAAAMAAAAVESAAEQAATESAAAAVPPVAGSAPVVAMANAPKFSKGQKVEHVPPPPRPSQQVRVLAVHTDDPDGAYYTVSTADGREIETTEVYLRPLTGEATAATEVWRRARAAAAPSASNASPSRVSCSSSDAAAMSLCCPPHPCHPASCCRVDAAEPLATVRECRLDLPKPST